MPRAKFHWPNGKRLAVSTLLMFEAWSEGNAPQYSVQTSGLRPNTRDHSGITWSLYGGHVGALRLMRTLDDFDIRGTFCTSARCIELFPDTVTDIFRAGHDIAAHGITQDGLLAYLSPTEQQAEIRKCIETIEQHTGKRPEGWISPVLAWTPETVGLVAQEGLQWYGDVNYFDLPRILETEHGSVIGIPVTEFSDLRVLRSSPRDLVEFYEDTFDYLYHHEPTSMITFVMHCHWGGRPPMVAVFRQVLQYMSQFPDVWFTNHAGIARWVRELGIGGDSYSDRYLRA
jgi:peptidoglycan/xylan/chitin deacetylase (PgdA/CDA1 family)